VKVVAIVGARPQFVKAAVVSRALRSRPGVEELLVHTGQHYDPAMSDVFFAELGVPPPSHHLGIGSGSHGAQTGRMLEAIEKVVLAERPEWVLVYGDTNTTMAGALAAAKLQVKVAHVEAGLRSFNRRMPEEINRVVADHVADLCLAPTETAVAHLRREGIPDAKVRNVGDVMYDVALAFGEKADAKSALVSELGLRHGKYVLATVHRAETTDDPRRLRVVLEALTRVAARMPVVLPIHPRTRNAAAAAGLLRDAVAGLHVIPPVGYLDMAALERHAGVVATDSGGVQKEAFFHGVPCVTLREETEWTELVEAKWNRLVPPIDATTIAQAILEAVGTRGAVIAPYGRGDAAERVADALLEGG